MLETSGVRQCDILNPVPTRFSPRYLPRSRHIISVKLRVGAHEHGYPAKLRYTSDLRTTIKLGHYKYDEVYIRSIKGFQYESGVARAAGNSAHNIAIPSVQYERGEA